MDCPTLQAIGPQATNQAVKAIAIARTFLKESQSIDICMQPEFFQLEDGHSGLLLPFSPWSVAALGLDCARAHDFHHSHNSGNYGGFFMFWDWACGTDAAYKRHLRAKRD